jgi:PPM family protein phosphatase
VAIKVELFGLTDVGLARQKNEDALLLADLDRGERLGEARRVELAISGGRGLLLVVCDGMGGAAGGEVASRLAAEVVLREMQAARPTGERAVYGRQLRRAIRTAHQAVLEEARRKAELRGMGSTVSAAGVIGGALVIAQVGDSRAYVERGDDLIQVTRDQSVVSALVHAGRLSEAEARLSDKRSLILQALGSGSDVDVALSIVELRRGDRLLLCSDGLHGPVADTAIRFVLAGHRGCEEAARALLALAHQGGAPDNATIVVGRFTGDELPAPGDGEVLRFTEFDPREESDGALTSTSQVARRLAVRAGLREGTLPPMIPATGQHKIVRPEPTPPPDPRPAEALLARSRRLGLVAWLVAAALVGVVVALALLGYP